MFFVVSKNISLIKFRYLTNKKKISHDKNSQKLFFFFPQNYYKKNLQKQSCKKNINMSQSNYSKNSNHSSGLSISSEEGYLKRHSRRSPIITVVGRGNVGKSTLVNRISGAFGDGSIVHDMEGITIDKSYRRGFWNDYEFLVIDTGGFIFKERNSKTLDMDVKEQALIAIKEASVIIFVVDGQSELNANDFELANFLKFQRTPVLLAVNKCENLNFFELNCSKFWSLGIGSPIPVSAIHGTNTDQLLDQTIKYLPKINFPLIGNTVKVAIIGKPNVGKSSILNFLTGRKRAIVSDFPGTTRDSCDSFVGGGINCNIYNFIDTAGIRKRKMVEYGPEFFMVNRAFKAIQKCDCVLFVIDSSNGITEQDQKLSERIYQEGKACVIIFNKSDKISMDQKREYQNIQSLIKKMLYPIAWADLLFTSTVTGNSCSKIFDYIDSAVTQYKRHILTSTYNEVVREAMQWRAPPLFSNGKQGKIYYCTQVSNQPPTIAVFVNNPSFFTEFYRKYLEGQFRNALGLRGTPIKILWTKRR